MANTSITIKWLIPALAAAVLTFRTPGTGAAAEAWPNRPVRLIVTLAGSGVDIGARIFADKLSARWGQPVVVENRPGGDGIIAITAMIGAHDDHGLLVTPVASCTAHPYFHDKLPYQPRDLVPIARMSKTIIALSVLVSLNVNSIKELEALAREKPGQLNWTTATGFTDFLFAGFLHGAGLTMAKVPYKNPTAAGIDLAQGRIQVYMPAFAIVRPQVATGKVKLLAVTNHECASGPPDIPTAVELRYRSLDFDALVGLFCAKIAGDIRAVAEDPTIAEKPAGTGQIASPGNGAEFAASIEQQKAQVAAAAKLFGNKPIE